MNEKHLKIIHEVTGDSPIVLHVTAEECLQCMQVLQDEIDRLEKLGAFLDENLENSKAEGLQNIPFGQGWISALMHVKVNFLNNPHSSNNPEK